MQPTTPRPDWILKGTDVTVRDVITGRAAAGRIVEVLATCARVRLPKGSDPKYPNRSPIIPFSYSSAERYSGSLAPVGWRKGFPGDEFRSVLRIAPPTVADKVKADEELDTRLGTHLLGLPGVIPEEAFGTPVTPSAVEREIEATLTDWEANHGDEDIVDALVIDEDAEGIDERLARILAPVAGTLRDHISERMQEMARRRARANYPMDRATIDKGYDDLRQAADALADILGDVSYDVPF